MTSYKEGKRKLHYSCAG